MVTGWVTLNGSLRPTNNSRAVECYSLAGQAEGEDSGPQRGGDLPKTPQQGQGQNQTAAGCYKGLPSQSPFPGSRAQPSLTQNIKLISKAFTRIIRKEALSSQSGKAAGL